MELGRKNYSINFAKNFVGKGSYYDRESDEYQKNQEMQMRIKLVSSDYIVVEGSFLNEGKEIALYKQ